MAKTKLLFVGTSMVRFEKNEDGEKVRRRYFTGDEVEVNSGEVDKLLEANVGGRPIWVKTQKDLDKAEEELPRQDVGATDLNATVPASQVTTEAKVVPKDNPQKPGAVKSVAIGTNTK